MAVCPDCGAPIKLTLEGLTRSIACRRCQGGTLRVTRWSAAVLLLGGAAYLPVAAGIFVELFGADPTELLVRRNSSKDATGATFAFMCGAFGWLWVWWRIWRRRYSRLR